MALNLVSPGVQTREIDLTIGSIDTTSEQVGAFVGPFTKGPLNEPILIENEQDLISNFGEPSETDGQNEYWLSASSYLSYGGVLRVVRADSDSLVTANTDSITDLKIENSEDFENNHSSDTTWSFAAKTPGRWGNNLKVCTIDAFADQTIAGVGTTAQSVTTTTTVATKTGDIGITTTIITGITTTLISIGNEITNANVPGGTEITAIGVGQITIGTPTTNAGSLIGETFDFTSTTTSLQATDIQVGYAVTQTVNQTFAQSGTVTNFSGFVRGVITGIGEEEIYVKIVDRVSTAGVVEKIDYKDPGSNTNTYSFQTDEDVHVVTSAGITTTTISQNDTTVSDWYNNQKLGIDNATVFWKSIAPRPSSSQYAVERSGKNDQMHVVVVDDSGALTGTASNIMEKHTFLSKAKDARISPSQAIYYKDYIARGSANVYAGHPETGVASNLIGSTTGDKKGYTIDLGTIGGDAQSTSFNVTGNRTFAFNSGENYSSSGGLAPTLANVVAGYDVFRNPAEYNVDYLIAGPSGGTTIYESQAKANSLISIAEERKDCIAVISPHKADVVSTANASTQTDSIIEFFEPLTSSSYAVFDSGIKYTFDRFNNKFLYLETNADIAGLMARTSVEQYSWFSPAGANRGAINNAIKLAYNPSQAQRDALYQRRINPVIASPGSGIILFGDKTALGYASAFDRINVRRLFLTMEQAIESAARSQLFEFNDEITRNNFINIVEPYLRDVKGKRGITEFIVVCDESNNTPEVIDANQFKADIFVKPARSINFISLTFVATRTGISFSEVVGNV